LCLWRGTTRLRRCGLSLRMSNEPSIPFGFTPSHRTSALLDLVGPVFENGSGSDYRVGLRVDDRHTKREGLLSRRTARAPRRRSSLAPVRHVDGSAPRA